MDNERVGDMTLAELRAFIKATVEELQDVQKPSNKLSAAEIVENVRRHRPALRADAASNLELLREDRDR